jgi:hypothetical protein
VRNFETEMRKQFQLTLFAVSAAFFSGTLSAAGAQPARATAPALAWTTFQDPFEKSFTVDVPQGWTARGGLFRMGYSDERPMVDVTSPDGRINVRLGDLSIPVFTVPSQNHMREGEVYDLGAQAQLVVARYRTGPEFAALYARGRFAQSCRKPAADTGNVDFVVPDYLPQDAPPAETSTGQIAYRCASGSIAFAFARTSKVGAALWGAATLGSFVAPPDQVAAARAVLLRCAQSFKLSPEWLAYQKKMDAYALDYQRARQQQRREEIGRQVQQFESQMAAMRSQVDSFRQHQAAQSAQVEGFTQALRGVTPTLDPMTGETREVWTGPASSYWSNSAGGVVNSNSSPGAGWHQLQVTSPN